MFSISAQWKRREAGRGRAAERHERREAGRGAAGRSSLGSPTADADFGFTGTYTKSASLSGNSGG
jgi:hypothetical protein